MNTYKMVTGVDTELYLASHVADYLDFLDNYLDGSNRENQLVE